MRVISSVLAALFAISPAFAEKPLKIYLMAGQSNMVGTGGIATFDHIGDDPKTAPMLELMRDESGAP